MTGVHSATNVDGGEQCSHDRGERKGDNSYCPVHLRDQWNVSRSSNNGRWSGTITTCNMFATVSWHGQYLATYCNATCILGYDTGSHWLQHWADSPQGLQGSRGTGESRETPKEVHQTDRHSSAGCSHCPGYYRTRHLPSSQAYNLVNWYSVIQVQGACLSFSQ